MADRSLPRRSAGAARQGLGEWLGLAAAPTFVGMALLTGISGGDAPEILCADAHGASPLGGMAAMYLLMAAFHLPPWLKRLARRRDTAAAQCAPR